MDTNNSSGAQSILGGAVALLALAFIGHGLLLFGAQVLYWLQTKEWVSVSLIHFFVLHDYINWKGVYPMMFTPRAGEKPGEFVIWLLYPQSWLGVHAVVRWLLEALPLSMTSFGMGFLIATGVPDYMHKQNDKAP